jgi:predicted O-methyltransferase YrrM
MMDAEDDIPAAPAPDLLARQQAAADAIYAQALELEAAGLMEAAQIGFEAAVALDLLNPELQYRWGGAFNGQAERRATFLEVIDRLQPAALVETGTYRGTSTDFMARHFAGPIHSCEIDRRCFQGSRRKLARFPQVELAQSDSRTFLRYVLARLKPAAPLLVYLDAHWWDDLPLAEEIAIILASGHEAAIMIDDFEVPDDPGYTFDDFGPGKRFCLEMLDFMADRPEPLFYPAARSESETGSKRGAVVLSTGPRVTEALVSVTRLRGQGFAAWRSVSGSRSD